MPRNEKRSQFRSTLEREAVGDLAVSFIMVALFVSLRVAHLQLRNKELCRLLVEVQTLAELLPICAGFRKVRPDDGEFPKVEEYFASRSRVKFTRGVCIECTTGAVFGQSTRRAKDAADRPVSGSRRRVEAGELSDRGVVSHRRRRQPERLEFGRGPDF